MIFTLELWVTGAAMTLVFLCNAETLPPPTKLSHEWLDPFTVNVSWSWTKPSNLPENCSIKFRYTRAEETRETQKNFFIENCLTEDKSYFCEFTIQTVANGCDGWTSNSTETWNIPTETRAQIMNDFKCYVEPSGMNCSWIPVNQSEAVALSYRLCGCTESLIKTSNACTTYYTSGERKGCYLNVDDGTDVCINAKTGTAAKTFKAFLVLPTVKFTVVQNSRTLVIHWQRPEVGRDCEWIYELCSTKCGEKRTCRTHTALEYVMPYEETCSYEFQSRIISPTTCLQIFSDFGEVVTIAAYKHPDVTLTVVAIVVPMILSVFVVLSCYCFRRHSHIIFPTIPEPRDLLKEIMNRNKDLKITPRNVYTPQPENTESCKLVNENSDPQQSPLSVNQGEFFGSNEGLWK